VFSQGWDDGSEPPAPTSGLSAAKKKSACAYERVKHGKEEIRLRLRAG